MSSGNRIVIFSIVGIVAFYLIFALYSDIGQVGKSISSMNLSYIPAILLLIGIGVLVKGIRQFYLLRLNNVRIPFKANIVIYVSGLSLIFTPGGVGGLVKTKFLKDNFRIPVKNTIPVALMELYHEFLGLVTLIAIGTLFYDFIEANVSLLVGSSVVVLIFLFFRYPNIINIFKKLIVKIRIFQKIIEEGEESHRDLLVLTSSKAILIGWTLTIISMIFELVGIYLVFLSFNIIQFNLIYESQLYLTALLFGQLSFLPNGIGVTDFSFIGMLVSRKLELASATSVVLLVRFISLWFKTGLGLVALRFLGKKEE